MTLEELKNDPLGERCCGITDEDLYSMARKELAKLISPVKAMRNKAIVWIAPFRKDGIVEVAWDFVGNSVEAVMVSDGTGAEIPRGTLVMVRPDEGILHEVDGVVLCFIAKQALMLLQEAA